MMRRRNFEYLKAHILPLSVSPDFNIAKAEWTLDYIYMTEDFGRCPCTQQIKEHCVILNKKNGNQTHVGNVCVNRFMDIDARSLFRGMKKIRKNQEAKPNRDLIEYALRRGFLYGDNEYEFLRNIEERRNLSERQKHWLSKINRRIIEKIVVRQLPNQDDLDALDDENQEIEVDSTESDDSIESDDSTESDDSDNEMEHHGVQ